MIFLIMLIELMQGCYVRANVFLLQSIGKAGFARFTSTPKGTEPNSFVLEWTSKSHTEITTFELK